jgi:hypothetical protein
MPQPVIRRRKRSKPFAFRELQQLLQCLGFSFVLAGWTPSHRSDGRAWVRDIRVDREGCGDDEIHDPHSVLVSCQWPRAENADLLAIYEKELRANPHSSITHFRMGEIYLQQGKFLPASNAFREALTGDLQLKWVEVWSFLNLGKIFDIAGQRERAVNSYTQAVRTKDNTRGAVDEAETYMQTPYPRK